MDIFLNKGVNKCIVVEQNEDAMTCKIPLSCIYLLSGIEKKYIHLKLILILCKKILRGISVDCVEYIYVLCWDCLVKPQIQDKLKCQYSVFRISFIQFIESRCAGKTAIAEEERTEL